MELSTLRTHVEDRVFVVTLSRPEAYNTITPELREDLVRAIDAGDADDAAHVILLRAEGPAFCAGYGLDWSTEAQAGEGRREQGGEGRREQGGEGRREQGGEGRREQGGEQRVWDSVSDMRMIGWFVEAYTRLWYARKPTLAAVQGWCIGGGTDLVLCADLVVAGEGASFGYPPSRVWGTPTTAMWVYRMGLEQAKRYMLTGDEIPAARAAEIGLILECVPDDALQEHALALARRMARLPKSQLVMLKLLCNQTVENMGFSSSRTLGTLFDGIARHTQEGLDFVARAQEVGFRQAVRERDDPFGDYGSRRQRKGS